MTPLICNLLVQNKGFPTILVLWESNGNACLHALWSMLMKNNEFWIFCTFPEVVSIDGGYRRRGFCGFLGENQCGGLRFSSSIGRVEPPADRLTTQPHLPNLWVDRSEMDLHFVVLKGWVQKVNDSPAITFRYIAVKLINCSWTNQTMLSNTFFALLRFFNGKYFKYSIWHERLNWLLSLATWCAPFVPFDIFFEVRIWGLI